MTAWYSIIPLNLNLNVQSVRLRTIMLRLEWKSRAALESGKKGGRLLQQRRHHVDRHRRCVNGATSFEGGRHWSNPHDRAVRFYIHEKDGARCLRSAVN